MLSTLDVLTQAGITHRMLGHWVRQGFIAAVEAAPGSGNERQFTEDQARAAIIMGTLVRAGFRPERAAHLTRLLPPGKTALDLGYYGVNIAIRVRL